MNDNNEVEPSSGSSDTTEQTGTSLTTSASESHKRDQSKSPGLGERVRSLFFGKDDPPQASSTDGRGSRQGFKSKVVSESSKSFGTKAKPVSLRGKLFFGGGALLAGLAAFVGFGGSGGQVGDSGCDTVGCHYIIRALQTRVPDIDICEDFFGALCPVPTPKPQRGVNGSDHFSRLDDILETMFKEKLYQFAVPDSRPPNMTGSIFDSEMQIGKFYHSCLNRHKSTGEAHRFFRYLVNDLGIPMATGTDRQTMSILSALVRLSLVWGIRNPLLFVELVPVRGNEHYITRISTLSRKSDKHEDFVPMTLKVAQDNLADFVTNANKHSYLEEHKEKFEHGKQVLAALFEGTDTLDGGQVREMVAHYQAVQDFILEWQLMGPDENIRTPPHKSAFEELEAASDFPWRRAITYGVRQDLTLPGHATVIVDVPARFYVLARLLVDKRFHRVFRHYLHVWLLEVQGWAMGASPEKLYCKERSAGCPDRSTPEGDSGFCFRSVSKACLYQYSPRSVTS